LRVLLILLFIFSNQVSATSFACSKDAQGKTITSGLKIEIEENSSGNWLTISVPEMVEGFPLTNTEIIIGSIEKPDMIFALKTIKRGNSFISNYFSKVADKTSKVYASYGGQCSGVMVVQRIYT
jgi:hypothetical protein